MTERMTDRTERMINPLCASAVQSEALPPKRPPQNQQVAALPKLHRTDESRLYIQKALEHTLAKVEADQKPITRKEWRDYERLRQLAKMLRQAGIVPWWAPVAFAAMAMVIIVALVKNLPKSYIYAAPADTWRILSDVIPKDGGFEVVMQRVHEGVPLAPWEMHFCSDYRPLFEVGMSLTWFAYEDRGSCISIRRKDLGYVIARGGDTWPLLARNCRYHDNPAVAWGKSSGCDGKPLFD